MRATQFDPGSEGTEWSMETSPAWMILHGKRSCAESSRGTKDVFENKLAQKK